MERQYLKSVEGSPQPSDIFQPHMPGVDVLTNLDDFFEVARRELRHAESIIENGAPGQRALAILTPGRILVYQPCPLPGSMSAEQMRPLEKFMPATPGLNITVISYTHLKAFLEDTTKLKSIPFLGILLGYAYIGHSVVVFEGHPSAFESGVRNSDVLMLDDGMLPFIQPDWIEVALRVMRPEPKIFVIARKTLAALPVVKSDNAKGWQYAEPDGEASYANCLLMMLVKGIRSSVVVASGQPLPNLADFTTDPEDLDWIKGLPFRYDQLEAEKVIEIILQAAACQPSRFFKTTCVLTARLADERKEKKMVSFTLTIKTGFLGKRELQIER
jgi:hypothetical protein